MSRFDAFPYLKDVLAKAQEDQVCLVVADSEMSAWLFTCILQSELGKPTPAFTLKGVKGYEIRLKDCPLRDLRAYIAIVSKAYAKKTFGGENSYREYKFSHVWDADGAPVTLEDWREKEGLIRKRPASRFERLEAEVETDERGKRLDEFPAKAWISVERREYKRKVVVQVVSWPTSDRRKLVRDAHGREFGIEHREVLSAVRVPRPKRVYRP